MVLAQCNDPAPPGLTCSTAPIINLDGYCSSTGGSNSINVPATFCGSVQNNQWIGFIAGSSNLSIDIEVGACSGTFNGSGLQAQIFSICQAPWTTPSINCIFEIAPFATSTLSVSNLVIGDTYYLMIDGFAGDLCDYSLQVVAGSTFSGSMSNCFFTEDFEDATVSYATSVPEFTDGSGDFFIRTDGSNVGAFINYNNPVGTSFFAAMDIDGEVPSSFQTMTYDDLPIDNFTNIELCVYLAEDDDGSNQDWDAGDFFHIGYDIDNSGTFTPAIWVEADPSTLSSTGFNGVPTLDTDFDGEGDGAEITDDFTQYCFSIPATGSVMDIQIEFELDAGDEDIALDELTLCGIFVQPSVPTISQVDVDGDGIPDITDPCDCDDPQNLSNMGTVFFYDFVTITSSPGEIWEIANVVSGALYQSDLTTQFGVGTVIPEIAPGVYQLEFWTETLVGFSAEFNIQGAPLAMPLTVGSICDAAVCCDLAGDIISTLPSCPGDTDGSITFANVNCTSCTSVEYSIDNITYQSSPTFNGLGAGTYQVFARDTDNFQCIIGMADFVLANPIASAPIIACPPADQTVECDAIPTAPTLVAVDLGNTGIPVWINEIHYDNTGTDQGEFIEVAGIGCTDLTGYSLVLYNGSNGQTYNITNLSGNIPDEGSGFGAVSTPIAGIQNGAPDGIALVLNGAVVQFLSYEGAFMANNGPAVGLMSMDIGVSQPSNNPIMLSLQLMGTGSTYSDFLWSAPSQETPGVLNTGQTAQGNVTVIFSENTTAGSCVGESIITRTWEATSACGLTNTIVQTITVEDNGAPTATCQSITIELGADGNAIITPDQVNNASSDNCGAVNLSLSQTSFTCADIGDNNVTLTVTDDCGNTSTCNVTVTVQDNLPPTLTCPSDQTIHLDPGACEAFVNYIVEAEDNCEFTLTTTFLGTTFNDNNGFAGNMFDVEAIGNSSVEINSFDINLNATGASVDVSVWFTTTATSFVGNETDVGAWTLLGSATVISNGTGNPTPIPLGGLTLAPGDAKGIYVATTNGNFLRYTNGNGNNQNYSDSNLSIETGIGRGAPAFTGGIFNPRVWNGNINYTFLAAAPPVITQTAGLASGNSFPIGTTTNSFTATDAQGNSTSCTFNINVIEYVPQSNVLTCNSLVNISLDENCQSVVGADQILEGNDYGCYDNYDVLFKDGLNAGQPVILGAGDVGNTYAVEVVSPDGFVCWGNIFVEDKLPPTLVCYDMELDCDEPLPTEPAPAMSIASNVFTLTDGGNGGAAGGMVYFDVSNSTALDLTVTTIQMNISAGTLVDVYLTPGTHVGNEPNAGVWTLVGQLDATTGPFSGPFPGDGTLTDAVGTFAIPAGSWGLALHTLTAANNYTNGNGANQSYTDGVLTLDLGAASNTAFAPPFTPRVFNGNIIYEQNFPQVSPSDACGVVTVTFDDVVQAFDCTPTSNILEIITRTWTVTDGSGNATSCTVNYTRVAIDLQDIIIPANVTIDCECDENDIFQNTNPSEVCTFTTDASLVGQLVTGQPTGDGCNIDFTKEDEIVPVCSGTYKVLRTWTVIDWCTNAIREEVQIIKVADEDAPVLTCPDDFTIGTTSNACVGNAVLPQPTFTDCGGGVTLIPNTNAGTITFNNNTNQYLITGLPLGVAVITWAGTDDCGNESTCTYEITVVDNIAPIAICDEFTVVGLGSDGEALIEAITFDDGSTDNCGIVSIDARRMDNPNCAGFDATPFGPFVPFKCCDKGTPIMVEFRVTDAAGNSNTCMVEVEVQDKLDPVIVCPTNKTIECDDDTSTAFTGEAVATDNCPGVTITVNDISNTVDDCGEGQITRVFTATDAMNNSTSCIQIITVVNPNPFFINANNELDPNDDIVWPIDYTTNTCGQGLDPDQLQTPYNFPVIDEGVCNNIAITNEDQVLDFGAQDACLKILRKWIVIDWCQADQNQDPTQPGPGVWHYTQVIKVENSAAPNITPTNLPTTIDNFDPLCGDATATFSITADDDCTDQSDLEVTWMFSTGLSGTGFSASGNFANGNYSLTFTVNDQCGNESELVHDFEVVDAKQPTPVCIFGIASVIMPSSGAVDILATDFESGSSYDNCTPYNQLIFSFSPVVAGQPIDDVTTISCSDIPADGLVPVTLYVTDGAGNFDFCTTFISVQDPNGACPPVAALISGTIENENQEVIEEVTVTVSDDNGTVSSAITGVNGFYSFGIPTLSNNGTYDVTPAKDINYLNGVTTYDLVLISKHILGTELFDSPYKWIAADANHSETITTLDIVKLRALILHIDDELADNDSWRFVDAAYTFSNPNNPLVENFMEYAHLELQGTHLPANFVAVKIGDVNGTASPNSLLGSTTRTFDGQLALQAKATKVAAGEEFTVDFRAKNFTNITGYQFTLGFESNVSFVDLTTHLQGLSTEHFGLTKLDEGIITTSWNNAEGVSMDADAVLFSMTFRADTGLNTKDVFAINSRYTEAEAYDESNLLDVVLEFNGVKTASAFELYQNTPNPFKAETLIGFHLPEAGEVTVKIFDVSGRILRMIEMDATAGYNSINVNRADLDATGVLYYQVETATETATKKMIIVD
ncbi:MAG: HYR domain-containing protein [Bacteroidota bacterium]